MANVSFYICYLRSVIFYLAVIFTFEVYADIGCLYRSNGKYCGRVTIKGEIYCAAHKQEVDEKIRLKVRREMAEEKRKAEAFREGQVQIMAEGMARALGRVPCATYACKNYVDEGQRYCATCQNREEYRELKHKVKVMNDKLYDENLATLPTCQAKNDDGTPCNRKANPGLKYCFKHVGFDHSTSMIVTEDPNTVTKKKMAEVEDWIKAFKKSTKGYLPSNLQELRQLSAGVPSFVDGWGTPLYYESDGTSYALASAGPDKKFETSDDINIIRKNQVNAN